MNIYLSLTIDGSSASVMAATRTADGIISPLAFESQPVNVNDNPNGIIGIGDDNKYAVATLLRKIMNKIEGEYDIRGIYLGIMPRSLRGESIEIRKEFNGKHRVTERDIEALDREVGNKINSALIAKYDNGFIRDGVETLNARNEFADVLVRRSLAVVMNTRLLPDYKNLLPANVRLFPLVPTHVAIARTVTEEGQRVSGVLSFHIGNQSSGLTYLANDQVLATAVVPFGFDHVIHDMSAGEVPESKMLSFVNSSKMVYKCSPSAVVRFQKEGVETIEFPFSRALEAFNARLREIFSLAYDRVLATLNLEEMKAPVVVTTSLLNTPEFIQALSDMLEQDCILGTASDYLSDDTYAASKYIPSLSIIHVATENCIEERQMQLVDEEPAVEEVKEEKPEKKPKKHKPTIWERFGGQTLFNDEQ